MTRKARVYCDTNLTPIWQPNPEWQTDKTKPQWIRNYPLHDYLVNNLGFERMSFLYDGTINRAPLWCKDDLTLIPSNPTGFDWAREGNFSNPPQKLQVQMCAKLATQANHFGSTAKNFTPLIFDLESPSFDGSPESVIRMIDAIKWCKEVHDQLKVGAYYWPTHPNTKAEFDSHHWAAFSEVVDFAAPSFYPWNLPAINPQGWFDGIERWISLLDRFYPWLPRVAVILPRYQIYWPQNNPPELNAMNDKYVPFSLWQKILQFLVERDCDLFYWDPGALLDDTAKKYAGAVNKLQL